MHMDTGCGQRVAMGPAGPDGMDLTQEPADVDLVAYPVALERGRDVDGIGQQVGRIEQRVPLHELVEGPVVAEQFGGAPEDGVGAGAGHQIGDPVGRSDLGHQVQGDLHRMQGSVLAGHESRCVREVVTPRDPNRQVRMTPVHGVFGSDPRGVDRTRRIETDRVARCVRRQERSEDRRRRVCTEQDTDLAGARQPVDHGVDEVLGSGDRCRDGLVRRCSRGQVGRRHVAEREIGRCGRRIDAPPGAGGRGVELDESHGNLRLSRWGMAVPSALPSRP